jgi:hypothetical protein
MYTWFWRSSPHPALSVFDAPDSTTTCTRRNRSNTPLQALTLLNDQASFEFAQALAVRLLAFKVDDPERLRLAYRLCLCREPSSAERLRLEKLVRDLSEHFQANREEARSLLPPEFPSDMDAVGFASWLTVARVLLNLDEFMTRE